jgi:formylmethanofuran:tetrahydromethanopterin formyltransferase
MSNTYSATDLYLDKGTVLTELAGLSQDEIEDRIAAMVRAHALDSEPDASAGEINTATEAAAHEIRQAVLQATTTAIYDAVSGADNRDEAAELSQDIYEWLADGDTRGATLEQLVADYREERM